MKDGTDSWFSSALYAFVESIPTTNASASETVMVNKALERMTSFDRLSTNSGRESDAADIRTATSSRLGISKLGIFVFSLLGLFCAILWVLIGTSIKLLGRFISS